MANITFPPSPYVGQIYVFANNAWAWNGSAWAKLRQADAAAVPVYYVDTVTAQAANAQGSVNFV